MVSQSYRSKQTSVVLNDDGTCRIVHKGKVYSGRGVIVSDQKLAEIRNSNGRSTDLFEKLLKEGDYSGTDRRHIYMLSNSGKPIITTAIRDSEFFVQLELNQDEDTPEGIDLEGLT
jgi:hypothetical protein